MDQRRRLISRPRQHTLMTAITLRSMTRKRHLTHAVKASDLLQNSGVDGDEALKALGMEEDDYCR